MTIRASHTLRRCLVALFALTVVWGWSAAAEASVRGRRAVPDLRNPNPKTHRAPATGRLTIPVTLHYATEDGRTAVSPRRVRNWLARANRALEPAGVAIEVVSVRRLPDGHGAISRRRDRHQLAEYAPHDGTVHVFVAESLDLKYRAGARRRVRGLHWRYFGLRRDIKRREYVVVASDAPDTTLAHEIGHLLGLRHSLARNNIMCGCREAPSAFNREQSRQMRATAQVMLTGGGRGARMRADRRLDRRLDRRRR